jgi:hypothetical protein
MADDKPKTWTDQPKSYKDVLRNILGINWKSTILGIGAIVAAVGRIALAFRQKNYDFVALAEDGQLIMTTVGLILSGIIGLSTKDANVTGAGNQAKTVNTDTGIIKNIEGEVVGKQPAKTE